MPAKTSPEGPVDLLLVNRLLRLYKWNHGYKSMTRKKLLQYVPESEYLEEFLRPDSRFDMTWDFRRVRFFYDELEAGRELTPIKVDNYCSHGRVYPEPVLNDGHHRLMASKIFGAKTIRASYSGRTDLLEYLTGKKSRVPQA